MMSYQQIIAKLLEVQERVYGYGNGRVDIGKLIDELNALINSSNNSN